MKSQKINKRQDYISWDDYFMGVALLSAQRSKDPSTQVGACIVDTQNRIVGVGYNGFPNGCSDDSLPWDREGNFEETKYPFVVHAEVNAILNNTSTSLQDCRIFVALFPCNECAKVIIQSGIKEVIYLSNKYKDTPSIKVSERLFKEAGIKTRQLKPDTKTITIELSADKV